MSGQSGNSASCFPALSPLALDLSAETALGLEFRAAKDLDLNYKVSREILVQLQVVVITHRLIIYSAAFC